MKPAALSDIDLADLQMRLARGWVVRRDQIESLIAMALERNVLVRIQQEAAANQERAYQ